MDGHWVVGFVAGLLLLLVLYRFLTHHHGDGNDALSHHHIDPRDVSGVEHEWQGLCPRAAHRSLVAAVASHHRALMFRQGTTWKVQAGVNLSVVQRAASSATVTMYYVRGAGPHVVPLSGFAPPSPTTVDHGLVEHQNTAVSLAAAAGAAIARYDSADEAQRAMPADTASDRHFVVVGQPNDPSAYVVRVSRSRSTGALVPNVSGMRVYEQKN